ncbi:hypothetical protein HC031_27130 [Planosporangium thailandense]|uniref:Galactose oxidase n=1 Tax=Planosporangium thailandense TaxID=765197 RepID=A0ABX0Y4N4_9ACTN|nr:hypothetical protein [Planosporangium thailandense]NJC73367.1 hypothetical protein [Planosporangium thailandense]
MLVALVAAGSLTACSPAPSPTPRLTPTWHPVSLPVPPGRRAVIGDFTVCAGGWFAVGGVVSGDGTSAPAAWTSHDGGDWTPLPVRPASYYGERAVFSSVACRDRGSTVDVVAVGAANGGAHGNPRTATWRGDGSGIAETPAPFELYGGPDAVTVGRVAAGPRGFLVVGGRVSPGTSLAGAATWYSRDGDTFTLVDSDPVLGSAVSAATSAADATAVPDGWLVVGSVTPAGAPAANRDPGAWYSADGVSWRREAVPRNTAGGTAADDETLTRVTPWHGGALALGVHGNRFGAWLRATTGGGSWRSGGRFGAFTGTGVPAITGLAAGRGSVFAGGCDGATYRLWASQDGMSWREVRLPAAMDQGGSRVLLVAAGGGRLAVAAGGDAGVRIWLTAEPAAR